MRVLGRVRLFNELPQPVDLSRLIVIQSLIFSYINVLHP